MPCLSLDYRAKQLAHPSTHTQTHTHKYTHRHRHSACPPLCDLKIKFKSQVNTENKAKENKNLLAVRCSTNWLHVCPSRSWDDYIVWRRKQNQIVILDIWY